MLVAMNHITAQGSDFPRTFCLECWMQLCPEEGTRWNCEFTPFPFHVRHWLSIPPALCSKPQFPHLFKA